MTSKGMKPATVNLYRGAFRRFCKWATMRRYLPGTANPLGTTRNLTITPTPRRRVPARDFARLLDGCEHPQTRIIVALGLYLFLRASEVIAIDVDKVDLAEGEILVYRSKTKRWTPVPICAELDTELRRWLTWYANDVAITNGPLQPHWPLVPARRRTQMMNDGTGKFGGRPFVPERGQMNPLRRSAQIQGKVQTALRSIGWEVGPDDREGVHTLRRSGARALFDDMVATGEVRDGVLRIVSAMLDHRSVQPTELYLVLEADRERMASLLKGRQMFHVAEVTQLRAAQEA
jgi:integrase